MTKLIFAGLFAVSALGLAACGQKQENNVAVENVEDLNATSDMNTDMNAADMNMMDMNDMNTSDTGNATGNAATDNGTGY